MIVTKHYYYGVHPDHLAALEAIAQATVDEMLVLAQAVYNDETVEVWNCSAVRSEVETEDHKHRRLLLENHSSGYWAVLEWGYPFPNLKGYEDMQDFWFYVANGDPKAVDWKDFNDDWSYSRCSLFMQARKNADKPEGERTWYAPVHTLDFKHPLLVTLRNAIEIDDD